MSEFLHSTDRWLAGFVAMLALMALSAFLSASETALFFLSHDEIRAFRVGRPRERAAAALLADPDRVLTGILFWNLVVNLLYFAVSIVVSERLLMADLRTAAAVLGFVVARRAVALRRSRAEGRRGPVSAIAGAAGDAADRRW